MANVGDVTSDADMEELVAATIDRYGRLDILVTNAGIDGAENYVDLTRDEFERYLQVHITVLHAR
jgi:NAD(P)-dependent dehydrogenase (short-subunit alcohol dehydrogenase family)